MSLFQLATKPKHVFGDQVSVPARPDLARFAQVERICVACRIVKITAFPDDGGLAFRLWRFPGDEDQYELAQEPECKLVEVAAE